MSVLVLLLMFLAFLVIEMPVAIAMLLAAMVHIWNTPGMPMTIVVQRMASGLDSFPLLAIPLFILAGNLINTAGIAERIFAFASALVGHIRGSLAHVNIVASMIFSGMSGVAQADAAGLGVIEINAMRKEGFSADFAAAVSAASAIIGPIIPPSVLMVVYAVIAQVSVAELFLGGILPGVIMGLSMMALVYAMAATGRVTAPVRARATAPELRTTFVRALPALVAPIILVGGIMLGVATPTELAAITVLYVLAVGLAYGELSWQSIRTATLDTFIISGVLTFIVAAAVPFGWLVAVTGVSKMLVEAGSVWITDKYVALLIINLFLLVLGMFMEAAAILLIVTPALLPLVKMLGIDLVHFGLVVVMNLVIGMVTPPFGMILFITAGIAQISFARMCRAILPFYVPLFVTLLIVTYIPWVVSVVPNLIAGR